MIRDCLGASYPAWQALAAGGRSFAAAQAAFAEVPLSNALGRRLQPARQKGKAVHYEAALCFRGEVAFRPETDHDWLNLLAYRLWPRAKAALNLRHTLHYLLQLRRLHPGEGVERTLGRGRDAERVPRDNYMQSLANLDEGGCLAPTRLLRDHAFLDERLVWRWKSPAAGLQQQLRWFGHALPELALRGEPRARAWVTSLDELSDESLARRILECPAALAAELTPFVERLGVEPFFTPSFSGADLFAGPVRSIWLDWG